MGRIVKKKKRKFRPSIILFMFSLLCYLGSTLIVNTTNASLTMRIQTMNEELEKIQIENKTLNYEIENLEILIEELYTRIYEKNPGKKVCSECALLFGPDHVRIIVRDNGVIFNFVDENNSVESLNAHVLNSLLERTEDKQYLITTSFNRNGFVFEK